MNLDSSSNFVKPILYTIAIGLTIGILCFAMMYKPREKFTTQKFKYNKQDFTVATVNPKESAKTLDSLLTKVNQLIQVLNTSYGYNLKPWDSSRISENLAESGNTSYTVNKGESMALCIRDKNNDVHDMNTLMFVAIHELAHNANKGIGHTKQFWNTMAKFLKIASQHNLYTIVDYQSHPTEYCGMTIDNTPLN